MTSTLVYARSSGGATKIIDYNLLVNPTPDVELLHFSLKQPGSVTGGATNESVQPFNPYFKIPGPAIIKVNALSDTDNSELTARFDFILVDD